MSSRKQIIKNAIKGAKGPRYGGPKNGRPSTRPVKASVAKGKAINGRKYL